MTKLEIELVDQGQDFTTIYVENDGVMIGNSIIFADRRLSLIGIGTLDGKIYYDNKELKAGKFVRSDHLYIYYKKTVEKTPSPWNASVLKYKVIEVMKG